MKTLSQYQQELIERGGFDFEKTLSDQQILEYFTHTVNLWLADSGTIEQKLEGLFDQEQYKEFILAYQDSIAFRDANPILIDYANNKLVRIDSELLLALRKHMNKHQQYFSRTISELCLMGIIQT